MLIVLFFYYFAEVVTSRVLGLDSQHPGGDSQQSISSIPGELIGRYMVQSKTFMHIK